MTIVKNNKKVGGFDVSMDDFWNPSWTDVLRPLCSKRLMLARAQLHLQNLPEDGKLHVDEERDMVVLWNVVISLYDDPAAGATGIYPPTASVDDVNDELVKPKIVWTTKGKHYIMDANALHFRKGASTEAMGKKRQMLVLTFSDGPVGKVDW